MILCKQFDDCQGHAKFFEEIITTGKFVFFSSTKAERNAKVFRSIDMLKDIL